MSWTKDLQKMMEVDKDTQQQQENPELNELKLKLLNYKNDYKKFYIWVEDTHTKRYKNSGGQCCFVDILGRPQKHGKDMSLLPYQHLLWKMLHEKRRLWIKKSRGIGLSTIMLYIIAYKIVIGEFKPGDRVVIITGIRIETVADLIRRLKLLFQKNFPGLYTELIKQRDTICVLNNVIVEGYPAGHTDSVRGLDRVKMVWVDEADWFAPAGSRAIRSAVEAFISKPNSENMYLVLSSTANRPGGLFQTIEKEDPSIYYKMFLPYEYGLEGPNPIYDKEQIEQARMLPDWSREYEGAYLGRIGNIFSELSIDNAQKIEYDPTIIIPNSKISIGVDPGTTFGIAVTSFRNGRIETLVADEYYRPDYNAMIDTIWDITRKYSKNFFIYVDAANYIFWQGLKKLFQEEDNDKRVFDKLLYCRKNKIDPTSCMRILPTAFSHSHGAQMMQHAKVLLDDPRNLVAIHPRFDKLLIALRSAQSKEGFDLIKDDSPHNDILDAYRLSLQAYKVKN